jgi:hypothetical protein
MGRTLVMARSRLPGNCTSGFRAYNGHGESSAAEESLQPLKSGLLALNDKYRFVVDDISFTDLL